MKRFLDYTDAELLDLYYANKLQALIDLECAMQGMPMLPEVPVKPVKPEAQPDLQAYKLGNWYFTNEKDAIRVLKAFEGLSILEASYCPGGNYTHRKLSPCGDYSRPKIETEFLYSEQHWNRVKDEILGYEVDTKRYDTLKQQYDDAYNARATVIDEINDHITDLLEKANRKERAITLMNRYMELAENNPSIATNFFKTAYLELYEEFSQELSEELLNRPKD
jgi:hypothetical protein